MLVVDDDDDDDENESNDDKNIHWYDSDLKMYLGHNSSRYHRVHMLIEVHRLNLYLSKVYERMLNRDLVHRKDSLLDRNLIVSTKIEYHKPVLMIDQSKRFDD